MVERGHRRCEIVLRLRFGLPFFSQLLDDARRNSVTKFQILLLLCLEISLDAFARDILFLRQVSSFPELCNDRLRVFFALLLQPGLLPHFVLQCQPQPFLLAPIFLLFALQ